MKIKLLALTMAALPLLAHADDGVTVYGKIAGNLSNVKSYSATTNNGQPFSSWRVDDNTSRIGFKGSENLGNGVTAIWQVENRIHVDGSGTDTFASRDSFVGLQSELGKIRLGRLSDYANLDMEYIDPGSYSSVAGQIYSTRLDGRINNAIRYDSPNLAGFSFTTTWGADEKRANDSSGNPTNNQVFNLGLSYEQAGYFAKFSYENKGDAQQVNSSAQTGAVKNWWRVEAGYISDPIYLALGFQSVNGYLGVSSGKFVDSPGVVYNVNVLNARLAASGLSASAAASSQEVKAREAVLTFGYNIGPWLPYVSLTKGYDLSVGGSDIDKTGYTQYVVGTIYTLSKQTKAYASYGRANWGGNGVASESALSLSLAKYF
ncbi:porin [Aquitalea aquatica]|uniref:Porin n=1 Tax=Aquitalea aquatica TaxID=3044273 RepID=A0A838Y8B8_9NEIS|nr:porin [Aquitalea magnusonii]MBA4707265.1 porin [Aquitalea magnusonii]